MRNLIILIICSLGVSSCKAEDPIMNAAEQFYEKGLISTFGIELLREEYKQQGKVERDMVISILMGGGLYGYTAYPPLGLDLSDIELEPGKTYIPLPENVEVLQFFIDTKFFTPTEIEYLTKKASSDTDFTYDKAIHWIALVISIEMQKSLYPSLFEDK
jgi:hypothetical protein